MAMGTRKQRERQEELWYRGDLAEAPGHPFYRGLNDALEQAGFDHFCEARCRKFYHERLGRPSLAPRNVLPLDVDWVLRGDRERAWNRMPSGGFIVFAAILANRSRRADAGSCHHLAHTPADGRSHAPGSVWLGAAASGAAGLLKGKTIGIDATTLEANAAMKSIVRRDTEDSYTEYLKRLAEAAGLETSDEEALRHMDRRRKKKGSNVEWVNPHDPEAQITRMKDGRTALAYKAEHAVDMDTGAIGAVTTHGGAVGDTTSVKETLPAAGEAVAEQIAEPTASGRFKVYAKGVEELVADKGYHSGAGGAGSRGEALYCRTGPRAEMGGQAGVSSSALR